MAKVTAFRRVFAGAAFLFLYAFASAYAAPVPTTPLEQAKFSRISYSAEISDFLASISRLDPNARIDVIGPSVQGRSIEALVFSVAQPQAGNAINQRMKVMIIGTQHGAAEPAGGEALLVIARELAQDKLVQDKNVQGSLRSLLDTMDIILIPNANPDGRDLLRRSNANRVNINTDFVQASQPETRALKLALQKYQPDVLLDSHESAILKRQTLAREGYLTDFDAQFESANNPAVPAMLRQFAFDDVLPELTARITRDGLPAHRYIGEITSIKQSITNGGLTVQNFRNTAGMSGALSFLVETKLDSRDDVFPTYRNIAGRVERQLLCFRHFLRLMHEKQQVILGQMAGLRRVLSTEPVALKARYVKDASRPDVAIAMRKLDTRQLETRFFPNFRRIETSDVVEMPKYLAVTENMAELKPFLEQQLISFETLDAPRSAQVVLNRFAPGRQFMEGARLLTTGTTPVTLKTGTLLIDMSQPYGRLAILLLDPRSTSSVFRYPAFAHLLDEHKDFFIYPVVQTLNRD